MVLFFFMCHYVCTITDKQKKSNKNIKWYPQ